MTDEKDFIDRLDDSLEYDQYAYLYEDRAGLACIVILTHPFIARFYV